MKTVDVSTTYKRAIKLPDGSFVTVEISMTGIVGDGEEPLLVSESLFLDCQTAAESFLNNQLGINVDGTPYVPLTDPFGE